jgi:hypothetical protein
MMHHFFFVRHCSESLTLTNVVLKGFSSSAEQPFEEVALNLSVFRDNAHCSGVAYYPKVTL